MFDFQLEALHTATRSGKRALTTEPAAEVGNLLQVEQMLRDSLALNPDQLSAYFALYKLLFRQSRLDEAANVAELALAVSARLGRFAAQWQKLTPGAADWSDTSSPAHFYLFTLKALSFIHLRQGKVDVCRDMLSQIERLDPADSVGASVIRAYADGC
jgi:tetratricopeptide (TPR) repeat protein